MIVPNMLEKEYRLAEGLNVSKYRMYWEEDGEKISYEMAQEITPSEVMAFGTLAHCAILEPDKLDSLYVVWEGDKVKEKKRWAEYKEEHADKIITTQARLEALLSIGKRIKNNREAMTLLNGCETEVSMFFDMDNGAKCKARLDVVQSREHKIADIKTTGKIGKRAFWSAVERNGLFIQAGHYTEAYRKCYDLDFNPEFWFICIENVAPYRIVCRPMSEEYLEYGRQKNMEIVSKIKIGEVTGSWSTLADEEGIQEIRMPDYRKDKEIDASTGVAEEGETL